LNKLYKIFYYFTTWQ